MTPPLSHGELRQMEEAAKNKQATVGPIVLTIKHRLEQSDEDLKNLVMKAIYDVDVKIDKPQLIRALELDKELREGKLVEVVRCKKCSYSEEVDFGLWVCHHPDIRIVGSYVNEDWFCASGKRKEKSK